MKTGLVDQRLFRHAVGAFATGVVVVTARDEKGVAVGVTANSFTSVSLDPPLILWCLAKNARSCRVFERAAFFAVHILSAEQESVSRRFASRGEDKFAGVELQIGIGDTPLLEGSCTRLQCRTSAVHDGGDHIIIVGRVLDFIIIDAPPLVFHRGRYSFAATKDGPGPQMPQLRPDVTDDLLGYLLWRAFTQYHSNRLLLQEMDSLGQKLPILYALTTGASMSEARLLETTRMSDREEEMRELLTAMVGRGFVREVASTQGGREFAATDAGREMAAALIERALTYEGEIAGQLGAAELAILKNLLQRFVVEATPDAAQGEVAGVVAR